MWYAVPVEHLLLLLCTYTIVLVEEVEERTFWLFKGGIGARFQIAKVGENALFELLGVLYRSTEGLEAESEASNDVGARDVEEIVPVRH